MCEQETTPAKDDSKGPDLEFSKDVIQSISRTEAERLLPGGSEEEKKEKELEITRRMVRAFSYQKMLVIS